MTAPMDARWDQRQLAATKKKLDRWRGKPLLKRLGNGTMAGAQLMAKVIQAEAPIRTGITRKSVRARKSRKSGGTIAAAVVGPTVKHGPPLIRGHRQVIWGHPTDGFVEGNPFVDHAAQPRVQDAIREVLRELSKP